MGYKKIIPPKRLYKYISINGKTDDNKLVVGNIFQLIDGMGVNLTDLLFCCKENNLVIDWCELVNDCFSHNWSPDGMMRKIIESLEDVYNKETVEEILYRIKTYIGKEKQNG